MPCPSFGKGAISPSRDELAALLTSPSKAPTWPRKAIPAPWTTGTCSEIRIRSSVRSSIRTVGGERCRIARHLLNVCLPRAEDRAASSSDEGEGRDDDYEKPKKKLTIKLKGPAASGEGKPKTKKRRDGETGEDGEKKKKKKKKDKKKEKVPEPEGELDPEQQRKKEVDDDFKEALQVLKPKRSKKREDEDSTRWDGLAMTLKDDMMSAAMTDTEFRRNGQPSVAKLMQLQSIMEKLGRTDLQDVFLDNGILVAIHAWMEPSDVDGTLPPLDVQKSMLGVLEKYDVDANFIDRWASISRNVRDGS